MAEDTSTVTRRELLRRGTAGATALALGGTALAGTAGAQDEQNRIDLVGLTLVNPCNGEAIEITRGTLHVRQRVQSPDGGPYASSLGVNTSGVQGVGRETDTRYVVTSSLSNEVESSPATGLRNAFGARVLVVSQGSTDNFVARLRFHLDVDDGGGISAVRFEPVSECRG